jgi:hypothetical protein
MFKNILSFFYNIGTGFKNIIKWLPIIWNDRDWDYAYMLKILHKKLEHMEQFFDGDEPFGANAKKKVRKIKKAKNFCKRLVDDNYLTNALIEHEKKWGTGSKYTFKEMEGNSKFGELIDNRSEKEKMEFTKACRHSDRVRKQDIEYLFEHLRKHMETWWD